MTHIAGYRRPYPGTQPNHLHPPYVSSIKRAPLRPLVRIPHTLTEITGPQFGSESVDPKDCDLTRQHAGEPLGERIVVSGRVLDENARPVPQTLIEIWQANAAGRYLHKVDQHDAPLDPNFTGCGHVLSDSGGRYRFVTIRRGEYPWRTPYHCWRTVGPYFFIGLTRLKKVDLVGPGVSGERITIAGRVLDGDRKPVSDAMIEIWQANSHGKYAHPEDDQKKPLEPGFQGFGRIPVDERGKFSEALEARLQRLLLVVLGVRIFSVT